MLVRIGCGKCEENVSLLLLSVLIRAEVDQFLGNHKADTCLERAVSVLLCVRHCNIVFKDDVRSIFLYTGNDLLVEVLAHRTVRDER